MARINSIDRPTDAAFLLFHIAEEVEGITKIQKLLFIIEEETIFGEKYGREIEFDFNPYKMGPFSAQVYDEISLLLNMNAIEKQDMNKSRSDAWEFEQYTEEKSSNELANKKFTITEKGKKIGRELEEYLDEDVFEDLESTIEEMNSLSLDGLLEYVYTEYPDMTTKSEIKDQVLNH